MECLEKWSNHFQPIIPVQTFQSFKNITNLFLNQFPVLCNSDTGLQIADIRLFKNEE
jgi:hypothetical protein